MANIVTCKLTVRGEGRERIKDLFQSVAVPTDWGCAWDFTNKYGGEYSFILCSPADGDGITTDLDAIVIKGECKWHLPLDCIQKLSADFPDLEFVVGGNDLINDFYQRWRFKAGEGLLLDCIQGNCGYDDEPDVIYMQDGHQFLELPSFMPVAEKGLEAEE